MLWLQGPLTLEQYDVGISLRLWPADSTVPRSTSHYLRQRERERERDRETDRQKDRQRDRERAREREHGPLGCSCRLLAACVRDL